MEKLQWFKFSPSDYMMGKIQRCPEVTQARFVRLCCLYWNKECNLSIEDAIIEIDKEHLDILLLKKIIKIENDFLIIDFLNEQMENIKESLLLAKENNNVETYGNENSNGNAIYRIVVEWEKQKK
jgi:hypothetical protein